MMKKRKELQEDSPFKYNICQKLAFCALAIPLVFKQSKEKNSHFYSSFLITCVNDSRDQPF